MKVYFDRPNNLKELAEKIIKKIQRITSAVFGNVTREFTTRIGYCEEMNDAQFEYLIY